jgi:hypothetical protein
MLATADRKLLQQVTVRIPERTRLDRAHRQPGTLPWLFLAMLFLFAHAAAALHVFEHDLGVPQGKVCTTCITASYLSGACTDEPITQLLSPTCHALIATAGSASASRYAIAVRQRGPPAHA